MRLPVKESMTLCVPAPKGTFLLTEPEILLDLMFWSWDFACFVFVFVFV